jgi:hypothetical protein
MDPVDVGLADMTGRFNPSKSGFAFSAGGPIWGLDWCPFPESKAASQSSPYPRWTLD